MKHLYRTYQLFIAAPIFLLATIFFSCIIIVGCTLANAHFWGYWPSKLWAKVTCRILLLPIRVEGRENLREHQSYVFVANHQGAFDIMLIYGYLNRNFKWMMKKSLRKLPFVGKACEKAGHIYVDKSGPKAIQQTYDRARKVLHGGTSLMVFPEGARSFTGHMGVFRKGAFLLAQEIEIPIVPITIDGSFQILPRTSGFNFIHWHPLHLTIHAPIETRGKDIHEVMNEAYQIIMKDQPAELQGFDRNPEQ